MSQLLGTSLITDVNDVVNVTVMNSCFRVRHAQLCFVLNSLDVLLLWMCLRPRPAVFPDSPFLALHFKKFVNLSCKLVSVRKYYVDVRRNYDFFFIYG